MMNSLGPIAEVAFNLALDRPLDYAVPPHLAGQISIGSRVLAPFRTEPAPRQGYVVRLKQTSEFSNIKSIIDVLPADKQIPQGLLKLATWISDYYCCPREHAIWALLPAPVRHGEQPRKILYVLLSEKALLHDENYEKLNDKKKAVLDFIEKSENGVPLKDITNSLEGAAYSVKWLCDNGWLTKEERQAELIGHKMPQVIQSDTPKNLTEEQAEAVNAINESVSAGTKDVFLLHGVTGSGKTEVYLQAISHCLDQGKEAIVLVPEIALTPQTCERFQARFGDSVSILHSNLTPAERMAAWTHINEGRHKIAIGARSALFAPFRHLGLIIVDEEHENSYKQSDLSPRYNARDVAVVRGKLEGATVVLGSATPSLETYRNAQIGKYRLLEMKKRVDGSELPPIEIVDMKRENSLRDQGGIFSGRLVELIRDRLAKCEQIMLFLNRRGFATQLTCSKCGYTAECPNCSIMYTFHRNDNMLLCHLCGDHKEAPQKCPECGDPEIRYSGFGTERIESVAKALFPQASIARMDSDSMTTQESYYKILRDFRANKINILIGTQMIAKGLDFPRVTLVGIIQADIGLNMPDFRCSERIFQLITQVAGRAGRGETPGQVIVQTFTPQHYAIQAAKSHDFLTFYNQDIIGREALDFPPFTHMILILFRSEDADLLAKTATDFGEFLTPSLSPDIQVMGPMPSPLSRANKYYRYQMILRGKNIRQMIAVLRPRLAEFKHSSKVAIMVDVDPRSLM